MGQTPTRVSDNEETARAQVLIAGAGIAGLETLLALRALAGHRVGVTIVAPELQFFNRSMSVDQPFKAKRRRGIRLEKVFAESDARWIRAELDRVEHRRREAVTRNGERLPYDRLVSGAVGDDSTISGHALWWPPNKLAGRYLSSHVGEAADVMPHDVAGIPLETALDSGSAERPVLADISDTSVSRRNA